LQRASNLFDSAGLKQVNDTVAAAEGKTSAEIVPVVATDSGRYDRAEDLVGLFVGVGALVAAWLLFQREDPDAAGWEGLPLTLQLPALVAVVLGGFLVGTVLATRVAWLRRLFTPRVQMRQEVLAAARRVFFDQRVHHTTGSSGVLLYVSLYERLAVVLSDQQVLTAVGQGQLDQICSKLTDELRGGTVCAALCASIGAVGDILAEPMPRPEDDVNELSDALMLLD
jgi:putative membrane protein